MKITRTLMTVLFCAALLAFGVGCGEGSDSTTNNGGSDAGGDTGPDVAEGEVPQDWEYDSEYHMRFTKFQFANSSPGASLNTILASNIRDQDKKYPIVVLIHFRNIDTDAGTLDLRGGAGLKADLECDPEETGECEYEWDPQSEEAYTEGAGFDPESGAIDGSLESLDFIATFELESGVQKAVIPVKDLTLKGDLVPFAFEDEAGDTVVEVKIDDAELKGVITEEDADDSEIQLFPGGDPVILSNLLDKEEMNADLDEDGTNDAWALEGTFSTRQTTVVE